METSMSESGKEYCHRCETFKKPTEFGDTGLMCKECVLITVRRRGSRPLGIATQTVNNFKTVIRFSDNLNPIGFTSMGLLHWLETKTDFKECYMTWVESGYDKRFKPRVLRKNHHTGEFTLDNMQFLPIYKKKARHIVRACQVCTKYYTLEKMVTKKGSIDGKGSTCKKCDPALKKTYNTKMRTMYNAQYASSKRRGHPKPDYTIEEFKEFLIKNGYKKLFKHWKANGFEKSLAPSVDRIDSLKPYTLDNIQLVTWGDNIELARQDVYTNKGASSKRNKSVKQYTKEGKFLKKYFSQNEAERVTGVCNKNISSCALGNRPHAGGFKWKS